ncbi:MAG: CsgG/HfaB family protein [Pseudomonadota bacterium]
MITGSTQTTTLTSADRPEARPVWRLKAWLGVVAALWLTGCAQLQEAPAQETEPPQQSSLQSSRPAPVSTPYDIPMVCLADRISEQGRPPLKVAVGHIKDYTGRFSEQDGGAPVTQGGSLMVISALHKLGDTVHILERFDIEPNETEKRLEEQKRLGTGEMQRDASGQAVRWRLFQPGRVMQSDVFLVGGITEVNYNIASGGGEVRINGIGPRARTFTLNIAADLRLVETTTLRVIDTVSLQKQLVGYEVGVDVFRFFDDTLVDARAGAKNQEALNLGVRAVLELGVMELVAAANELDHHQCLRRNPLYRDVPGEDSA